MMTPKRTYYVLVSVLILLLILVFFSAYQGNKFFEQQSQKITDQKVEAEAIEQQRLALIQAKKDIEKYSELEKNVKAIVPQDKDQAKTVREIVQIAQDNNVPIKSVTFESSTLGDPKAKSSQKQGEKLPEGLSQVKPIEGIKGVYTLSIQISSSEEVPYQNFLNFLESLEKNRRTSHVDSIDIKPSEDGSALDFNLTLNAYLKP